MPNPIIKFEEMAYKADERLNEIAKGIKEEKKTETLTIRDFLNHFGVSRRKRHVKWWIDRWLAENDLGTDPDYKNAWIDGQIQLKEINPSKKPKGSEREDFVERLRILDAANNLPSFVTRNDSLTKAITIMAQNDYSQLPVMGKQEARKVDGIISWQSIGMATTIGKEIKSVSDCMDSEAKILDADYPILDAIPIVIENQVVLVQDKNNGNVISGLITITDIAEDYYSKSGPFMILGQIEFCIRELISDKFTVDELKEVKFGEDEREVNSVADLTFSEYIQLMRKGENWSKMGINVDKGEFTNNLDRIREIRNEVMHFSSEPLSTEDIEQLQSTLKFLKHLIEV